METLEVNKAIADYQSAIADDLHYLRRKLKMGRPTASKLSGVPVSTIADLENHRYNSVNVPAVIKLANTYLISPAELLLKHSHLIRQVHDPRQVDG